MKEFADSLYTLKDGGFGFPVTAVKKALMSVAHKDKGIAKTTVMASLWLDYEIVQARPAFDKAICDVPIVRIWGSTPVPREDMVRIKGRGGSTANFSYRAQFSTWAIRLRGKFNPETLPGDNILWLIHEGGMATGIGDWRNEKSGVFGAFRLPYDAEEKAAWIRFSQGKGSLPTPPQALDEAAE